MKASICSRVSSAVTGGAVLPVVVSDVSAERVCCSSGSASGVPRPAQTYAATTAATASTAAAASHPQRAPCRGAGAAGGAGLHGRQHAGHLAGRRRSGGRDHGGALPTGDARQLVAHARHRPARLDVAVHHHRQQTGHGVVVGQPRRVLVDDLVERADQVVADLVRRLAGDRVVERGAERPHVAGRGRRRARRDLGGEVGRRAGHQPGLGEGGVVLASGRCRSRSAWPRRRAIRMLQGFTSRCTMPASCASTSASAVWASSVAASVGVERARGRAPARSASGPSTYSITSQLHVLLVDEVEDGHHVRVVERGGEPRLALGALERRRCPSPGSTRCA